MRFVAAFAAILSVAAAAPAEELEPTFALERRTMHLPKHPKGGCAKGSHVVVVSQNNQPQHSNGALDQLVGEILQDIPNSNNYSVPYPKYKNDADEVVHSTALGAANTRRYIKWYSDHCPKVPLIVVSYSEGSLVAMNGICGRSHADDITAPLAGKYAKRIIAITNWGDPSFVSGQSWDITGNYYCESGSGVNPRSDNAHCQKFAGALASWCYSPDPICCKGSDGNSHLLYPQYAVQDTLNFIVGKYQAWQQSH